MAAPLPLSRVVVGLTPDEEREPAADYFARFEWEPRALDPDGLTAAEFLDAFDSV